MDSAGTGRRIAHGLFERAVPDPPKLSTAIDRLAENENRGSLEVSDFLLAMSAAIAAHLETLQATEAATQGELTHLRHSVRNARRQPFVATAHPYADLVERVGRTGQGSKAADIATHLLRLHTSLPWVYHYVPRSAEEDLGARIAFAELIGPDGPLASSDCRVDFTVMAEQTTYPMHSHPAVELYWVVSGTAQWRTPCSDRLVPPGELVLHRSNEPHAMRTFREPLLALWDWTGDIAAAAACK